MINPVVAGALDGNTAALTPGNESVATPGNRHQG
jgi:hypothetical protein